MYSLIPFTIAMGHLITGKLLASAFVGGCTVVFVLQAIKTVKDRRDSNRIYEVLCRFAQDGQYTFRSSGAISSITNLTQSRISDLCCKHPYIERKAQQRHMWRAVGNVIEVHEHAGEFKEVTRG